MWRCEPTISSACPSCFPPRRRSSGSTSISATRGPLPATTSAASPTPGSCRSISLCWRLAGRSGLKPTTMTCTLRPSGTWPKRGLRSSLTPRTFTGKTARRTSSRSMKCSSPPRGSPQRHCAPGSRWSKRNLRQILQRLDLARGSCPAFCRGRKIESFCAIFYRTIGEALPFC